MTKTYRLNLRLTGDDLASMDHAGTSFIDRYQTPFVLGISLILWILLTELVEPYIDQPMIVLSSTALVVLIVQFCLRKYFEHRHLISAEERANTLADVNVLIDDQGFRYISNRSTTAFQWSEFAKITEYDDFCELETCDGETAFFHSASFHSRREYLDCLDFVKTQIRLSSPVLN